MTTTILYIIAAVLVVAWGIWIIPELKQAVRKFHWKEGVIRFRKILQKRHRVSAMFQHFRRQRLSNANR
jgi:hypothetical protein